jgi:HlyD family secretion protein
MSTRVDVRQLAVRGTGVHEKRPGPRRRLLSRVVVPVGLAVAFAGLVAWAARDLLLPAREVTVMPVVARRTAARQAGTPLFSAAGWVEARPTPVLVSALADGVIDRLLVVEGQQVAAGEPVAYLIDADARLALQQAEADLKIKEAELERARAALAAAQTNAQQPVHLEAGLAEAQSLLAQAETELSNLPFELDAATARRRLADQDLQRKQAAGDAVAGREVQRARSERDRAAAEWEQLHARRPRLEEQVDALSRRCDALEKQLKLLTAETRALAEGEADVKAAAARLDQARVAEKTAGLRLERMTVRAPVAGRVLDLVARPGKRVAGLTEASMQEAGTVVTLYDPEQLQVRADVRLEDLPKVTTGQSVRIETAAIAHPLEGKVLFTASAADIQKNTLQVKVSVDQPPLLLKPEMLVQVTFLAPETAGRDKRPEERLRVFIPRQLIERQGDEASVWVADQAAGVARRQRIKAAADGGQGGLVEVSEGLDPASRLIVGGREGLGDGARIRVIGEDETLGIGQGENDQ